MYNETEFIQLIFLLADIQSWIDILAKNTFMLLPAKDKHKMQKKTYFLSVKAFAHILEKHYCNINRHPQAGRFTIPIPEIINQIKEAAEQPAQPVPGSLNLKRVTNAACFVGFNRNGTMVTEYTVITDAAGNIITAFPGTLKEPHCM